MTRNKIAILAATIIVGLAVLDGYKVWVSTQTPTHNPSDAATLAMGKQLYGQQCASCHGQDLQGQANWMQRKPDGKLPAPPHDATGHTWHHSDGDLFIIVKEGVQVFAGADYKTDMPAYYDKLSDDQIREVIAYIKSTWPEKQRKLQEQVTANAQGTPQK